MENPLVQSELQDICTFRKTILNSFQNIQYQLFKTIKPIRLAENCNCSLQNQILDPFSSYFIQKNQAKFFNNQQNFWIKIKAEEEILKKNKSTEWQNQNSNYLNFNLGKETFLQEQKNFNNFENSDSFSRPFEKLTETKNLESKLNVNISQNQQMVHSGQNISNIKNRKKISFNSDFKPQRNPIEKQPQLQQIKWMSEPKINTSNPNLLVLRQKVPTKSFLDCSKSTRKSKNNSYKSFQSKKQSRIFCAKQKSKISRQSVRQQIYKSIFPFSKGIKKRIYLSFTVCKSSQNSFEMIYKKELKQRQEIMKKFGSNPKLLRKFGRA